MLVQSRLKAKIKDAMVFEQTETQNHNDSVERFADKLATAIIEEIKELKVTYTAGLVAPNGAVTGTINHTVQ